MVACLSCTPDALLTRNPLPTSKSKSFHSQDVLLFLQKCTNFKQMKQIHAKIIRNGLSQDPSIVNKLLRLSSTYEKMDYATLLFNQLLSPPTFTWNLMIRAHTLNGSPSKAILLFNRMISRAVPIDKFTFPFVIRACLGSSLIEKGKEVHGFVIKTGFSNDIYLQNNLLNLYFKCGNSGYGRKVFVKMRVRNVVSWTTAIAGLVSCGQLDVARVLFEEMPIRNVVSWTAIIDGYVRRGWVQEAFELFWRMQVDNVRPNEFTLVSLLMGCTELGSLKLGRWIHDFALENGFKLEVFLGTALIDMYSKCGSLEDAKRVFDSMEVKSLATWNSMITSLGVHGRGEEALSLFANMEMENVLPDAITFVGVLCACVHLSDADRGQRYFKYMTQHYGIAPIDEHYTCITELRNHAKMLEEGCESANMLEEECESVNVMPV